MKYILTIIIIIGALTLATLNYHFILLDDDPINIKILSKVELTLDSTFVDARGMNKYKFLVNPLLLEAGIKDVFDKDKQKAKK